jgi:hypothetical protein
MDLPHSITCSDAIKNSGKASVHCTVLLNIYTNRINRNEEDSAMKFTK